MTDPLTTKEIVNHDEALSLAQYKRENSNLARCYIARTLELDRLTAERNAANACLFHMQEAAKALLAERDRLALDLAAEERGQDNLRREIVALTAERDELKAENERLREAVLSFFKDLSPIVNELYNGKLNGVSMRLAVSGDAMSIAKEIMRIAAPIRAALKESQP